MKRQPLLLIKFSWIQIKEKFNVPLLKCHFSRDKLKQRTLLNSNNQYSNKIKNEIKCLILKTLIRWQITFNSNRCKEMNLLSKLQLFKRDQFKTLDMETIKILYLATILLFSNKKNTKYLNFNRRDMLLFKIYLIPTLLSLLLFLLYKHLLSLNLFKQRQVLMLHQILMQLQILTHHQHQILIHHQHLMLINARLKLNQLW